LKLDFVEDNSVEWGRGAGVRAYKNLTPSQRRLSEIFSHCFAEFHNLLVMVFLSCNSWNKSPLMIREGINIQ
jgi:hypothetical protein